MIVDAHVHILPDRVRDNLDDIAAVEPWFRECHSRGERVVSAEALIAAMDENGVDVSVCFTWPFADAALCAEANDYVADACRRFPGRLIGFGVVQPAHPGAAGEVSRCARLGLRGVGEMNPDAQGWQLAGESTAAVVRASVDAAMPWNLHCSEPLGREYPGKGTTTPDRVLVFAERHPDLTIVCAHLGGGLPLYAHIPEVHAVCERLYFDTAAQPFVYRPSVYRTVVDLLGPERLLLGSDHPLLELPRYLRAFEEAALTDADRVLVTGANARRLFGL